jgi:hypothetical protein
MLSWVISFKNVIFRKLSFYTSLPGTMEFLFSLLIWKNDYSLLVKILVMCLIETIPEAVVKNNGNFATNNMLHHHDKYYYELVSVTNQH